MVCCAVMRAVFKVITVSLVEQNGIEAIERCLITKRSFTAHLFHGIIVVRQQAKEGRGGTGRHREDPAYSWHKNKNAISGHKAEPYSQMKISPRPRGAADDLTTRAEMLDILYKKEKSLKAQKREL